MALSELTLHPRTKRLAERYASNLPQGLIISGPTGSGVLTLAKSFAQIVGSPQFVIQPKKKINTEWSVDLNDGSVIIDDIRALYSQTRTRQPGEQVYIIDTGEKSMTIPAQNAFLKLLEEPRRGVHFIIATHHPDQLLSTIFSRSQELSVLPITDDQTTNLINSLHIGDAVKKARLAFVGNGKPALVRRLINDDTLYESRIKIMSDAKLLLGNDTYEKLTTIHKYKDNRPDAVTLIDDMNQQLQTIIRKQPDARIAADIDRHLATRDRILTSGNIRLQLSADVL